jgi:hypothetical protein
MLYDLARGKPVSRSLEPVGHLEIKKDHRVFGSCVWDVVMCMERAVEEMCFVADIIRDFVDDQSAADVVSKPYYHRVALVALVLVRLRCIVHVELTGFPHKSRWQMLLCELQYQLP